MKASTSELGTFLLSHSFKVIQENHVFLRPRSSSLDRKCEKGWFKGTWMVSEDLIVFFVLVFNRDMSCETRGYDIPVCVWN